jgi:glutamine synthetase
MKDQQYRLNPNKLVQYLKKPATQFTGQDIIRFIEENGIEMLNFRYAGGDGRLKTLNFVIQGREHLETLFSTGERVDGSSLFSYISSDSSDLYIIPRFRTAFGNTIPASYLRLVPGQEAPTKICWGDRNRSVLVRVPLGWVAKTRMIKHANPQETGEVPYIPGKMPPRLDEEGEKWIGKESNDDHCW